MITLTRIRTGPPVHSNFFGDKRFKRNLKLLKEKRDGKLDAEGEKKWDSSFWKESKEQLLAESQGKCAYCETPTSVVVYGDVEHFRPKSRYWWLAYSYENYLPSCSICNQKYKKDFFEIEDAALTIQGPQILAGMTDAELTALAATLTVDPVDDASGMPLQTFKDLHHAEKARVLNPYYDDPEEFLAYQPILTNQEILVVPLKPEDKPIVKACEKLYGVNRKELKKHRFQWYANYMTFRHTLNALVPGTPVWHANKNRLAEMTQSFSPYVGMVRYFDTLDLGEIPWDFNIQVKPLFPNN